MPLKDYEKEAVLKWCGDLAEKKGARAQLKRCASPEEAALIPETFSLKTMLPQLSIETVAALAGLLAHVKKEDMGSDASLGKQLASEKNGRVLFSESRFRQLLKSRDWNEIYTNLRRAVVMLEGKVSPVSIAETILDWNYEMRSGMYQEPGKSLKFRLSNDYYLAHVK